MQEPTILQPYDAGVSPQVRQAYHKWYRARRAAAVRAQAKRQTRRGADHA